MIVIDLKPDLSNVEDLKKVIDGLYSSHASWFVEIRGYRSAFVTHIKLSCLDDLVSAEMTHIDQRPELEFQHDYERVRFSRKKAEMREFIVDKYLATLL